MTCDNAVERNVRTKSFLPTAKHLLFIVAMSVHLKLVFAYYFLKVGLMFDNTNHSNFAVTYRNTYLFIPTDINEQRRTEQFGAAAILLYNTEQLYSIFYW